MNEPQNLKGRYGSAMTGGDKYAEHGLRLAEAAAERQMETNNILRAILADLRERRVKEV